MCLLGHQESTENVSVETVENYVQSYFALYV